MKFRTNLASYLLLTRRFSDPDDKLNHLLSERFYLSAGTLELANRKHVLDTQQTATNIRLNIHATKITSNP